MADSQLQVSTGFVSETGRRERNEDYAAVCLGGALQRLGHGVVAAVADGVSGAKGGRVAAETTVRQFIEGYYGQRETIGVQVAAARAQSRRRQLEAIAARIPAFAERPAAVQAATLFTFERLCDAVVEGEFQRLGVEGDAAVALLTDIVRPYTP